MPMYRGPLIRRFAFDAVVVMLPLTTATQPPTSRPFTYRLDACS